VAHDSPDSYVTRVIDADLDEVFHQLPAILVDGPKGVGKTATAERRCRTVRKLDVRSDRGIVEADPSVVGLGDRPVLVDEWHRVPETWDAVRRLVDADPTGGQFLLTGSPPTLPGTHTGAGRITTLRMWPLALWERQLCPPTISFAELLDGSQPKLHGRSTLGLEDYVTEIVGGGFPGMRQLTGRALQLQLDGYIDRIVDRELPEAGLSVKRPATLHNWLRAYAAATATTASWETIRDAATSGTGDKPAKTTVMPYSETLTSLRVLDPIPAWLPTRNHLSRITAAPKHHLTDPALAARLLRRTARHLLAGDEGQVSVPRDGTLLGALFESLVVLSLRALIQANDAHLYHLRTGSGRQEVDLIIERDDGIVALEAKLSTSVGDRDVRHLLWLRDQLGDDLIDAGVINTGPEAYRRPDGIAVIPLALLGP
jgi:hypothetical protein